MEVPFSISLCNEIARPSVAYSYVINMHVEKDAKYIVLEMGGMRRLIDSWWGYL